ncbi:MAG: hypothetical protein K2N78_01005 [Oscillospiraceae bacterium]|nr:hypothetical protein [Oscillospiraceae bacterium]
MQLFLTVTPDKLREAARYTDRLAHMAYRVGPDGHLTRQNLLARTRGGLMVLGDWESGPIRDVGALCREVWRECGNRGFGGVLADFEQPPSQDRAAFLETLGAVLARNNRRLYVPEAYGRQVPQACVLVCTALSGGNLRQRLEECAQTYGRQRLGLDLQRLRMCFPLPCPSGEGEPMDQGQLAELLERKRPAVFYSGDLCARYFTITEDGESRFILFDDADTLRRKIRLGQELGAEAAFLMYPETEDLLPELFGQRRTN